MKRRTEEMVAEELRKIVEALKPCRPKKVLLFGSFARGDHHGLSDIDLIVIRETDKKFVDRISEILELCDVSIPVEPLVYTPAEIEQLLTEGNSFIQQALAEAKVLYDEAQERG